MANHPCTHEAKRNDRESEKRIEGARRGIAVRRLSKQQDSQVNSVSSHHTQRQIRGGHLWQRVWDPGQAMKESLS